MKFVALERELEGAVWSGAEAVLKEEAAHVWDLQKDEIVESIYFSEKHEAILFLSCDSLDEARKLLADFPLVRAGLICFEVHALLPYDGFERLEL